MTRRSLLDRYEGAAQALDTQADTALAGGQLSPVHVQAVDVLDRLLSLGMSSGGDETPQALRMLLAMLHRSRPLMLDGISKVPDAEIIRFMTGLRDDIQTVIDSGTSPSPTAAPTLPPRVLPTEQQGPPPVLTPTEAAALPGVVHGPAGLQSPPPGGLNDNGLGAGVVLGYDPRLDGVTLPAVHVGPEEQGDDTTAGEAGSVPDQP